MQQMHHKDPGKQHSVTALWLLCLITAAALSEAAVWPPLARDIGTTETDTCGVAICFAIDESGSVGSDNFAKSKKFIIDLIDAVSDVATVAQYGADLFETTAAPVTGLASMTSNAAAAKAAIAAIKYNGGSTNMEGGIAECFRNDNGVKGGILTRNIISGLPRILFLLTDGKPNYKYTASPPQCPCNVNSRDPAVCQPKDYVSRTDTSECAMAATSDRAADATADGIKFISVGVGKAVNATFLESLGDYYPVAGFEDLQDAIDEILRAFCSDVMVSKSASDSPQPVGGKYQFRIDVLNTGKYDVKPRINFTDSLPAGLTYDVAAGVIPVGSSPQASCSYDASNSQVFCSINTVLPVGRTWSYTLGAAATTSGNWTNTAQVFANPDNNPNNDKDSVNVEVSKEPEPVPPPITDKDLNITKTVDESTVMLGTPFTYTITITNKAALATAENAYAVDTLPAGLQVVTTALPAGCTWTNDSPLECGPNTLTPGQSKQYDILVTAEYDGLFDNSAIMQVRLPNDTVQTSPAVAPVTVLHTCSKYELDGTTLRPYDCGEGYRVNDTAADNTDPSQSTCCIALAPSVSITKSVSPNTTYVDGVVTYTVTVSNTGDGNAVDVILTDQLTSGLVFLSPLPEETAQDCYLPDAVTCRDAGISRICRQGVLDTMICGPMTLAPDEVKVYTVNARAVQIGDWINTVDATYHTSTDPTNQTVGPVTAQESVLRTCAHYNDDETPFECNGGTEPNPSQANNTTPNQRTCCQEVNLAITKTAAASSVLIGSETSFLITAINQGDSTASGVTVRDILPGGLDFATPLPQNCTSLGPMLTCGPFSLAAKASRQFTIPVKAVQAGDWSNQAKLIQREDTVAGPAVANVTVTRTCANYYSDGSRFKCSPGSRYDASRADDPNPGQQTCCIDCKTCADFVDLCGEFDNGCDATINCTCPADKPYCHQPMQLQRTGKAGFCNDDPFDPSDNVDVSIAKDGPDAPVLVNTEFEFELTVRVEDGKNGARNVVVTDTLPDGLDLVSLTPGDESDRCVANQQVITCNIGTMALSETRFITIRVKSSQGATYRNVATVTATADRNSTNNRATKDVQVVCKTCASDFPNLCGSFDDGCGGTLTCTCPADKPFCHRDERLNSDEGPGYCSDQPIDPTDQLDVSITKTGPVTAVTVGQEFEFRLAARVEQGLQGANDVVVTDTMPSGLELVAVVPDKDCTIRYPTIVCNIGRLAFAETRFITIRAKSSFAGTYRNTATVTATNDTNPDDNTSTAVVEIKEDETRVNMAIRKTVNTPTVLISNQVSYTLTAENIGNSDAANVMVADTLPLGFAFVKPLPPGCIIQPQLDNRVLRCGPSEVAVGEQQSYVIKAQAVAAGTWDNAAVVTADRMPGYKGPVSATVTVTRTCGVYNSDGSRFQCSDGSRYNSQQGDNPNPDQQTCCIDCKTCADFPYQCGTFDNDCGTTIQCTCPADKPFCIQSNQLLDLGNPGYCSDKNIDPTDILDVSITKNGPDTAQVIGVEFDFELIVRVEQGTRGANSVVVTDTLPAGLTLVSTAADDGSGVPKPCAVSGRTITCDLGPMVLSETRFITITVRGNRAGSITNTASVEATGDNNDSNDSDDKTVQIVCKTCANSYQGLCGTVADGCGGKITCTCPPEQPFCHHGDLLRSAGGAGYCSDKPIDPTDVVDVSITKSGPRGGQVVGQEFDFVLTVRVEDGLDGAKNVVVKDTLPAGLELVAVQPGSSCSLSYPVITCIFPTMLYSETQLVTVTVKGNRPGRYTNRANVTADNDKDRSNNRDTRAVTVVAGSCCNPDGTCSQIPQNECQGQYQKDLPCSLAICGARPVTGACCLRNGGCRDNVRDTACANLGGRFFDGRSCAPGLCSPSPSPSPAPPGPLGSCCISSSKTCLESVTRTSCQQQSGVWKEGGQCIASFCQAAAAACCIRTSCFDVTSQQCAAQGGNFNVGSKCSSGVCGARNCTASWLPCFPCTTPGCTDQCCPGNSCKATPISGKNYYSCKPDDVCRKEGEPCGNCKGGGVCCSGLKCKWSFKGYNGRCSKPSTCSAVGESCAVDSDCCPGGRCDGKKRKCRPAVCSTKCAGLLGLRTNKCPAQQQYDCGAFSAAAASSIE